jgi:hypothetical protein
MQIQYDSADLPLPVEGVFKSLVLALQWSAFAAVLQLTEQRGNTM